MGDAKPEELDELRQFNRWRFAGFDNVLDFWRAHDLVASMAAFNCGVETWALSVGYETPDAARGDFIEILHCEFAQYADRLRQFRGCGSAHR